MAQWSRPPLDREQVLLFPGRLEEAIPPGHHVRLLDGLLRRLDWSSWEAEYHVTEGQPAIHPRVLASVLLYGLLKRIRSSRALEEALQIRLDFRWLAEDRRMDHTTLSEFRRKHPDELKSLFVKVGLLAREMQVLTLQTLAFDGTRLRANNRRSGTRTPDELRALRAELATKFEKSEQMARTQDQQDEELLGDANAHELPEGLANDQRRLAEIDRALAELQRIEDEATGEPIPKRLPLTDPASRVTPNKEGGFGPNFTPLATVDVDSGMIVAADVIALMNEDEHLVAAIQEVQQQFGLAAPPSEVLADGLMATGSNLSQLEVLGVTLYSPAATRDPAKNPALRTDLRQPVPADQWDRLPTKSVTTHAKVKQTQLTKEAFVYDAEHDCYWCPNGQALSPGRCTTETRGDTAIKRTRYQAETTACADCPLKTRCLQSPTKPREISRDQFEPHRERLAQRMSSEVSQQKYARRRHSGERPFAVIKHQFGARQFLLRGLKQVRMEWLWLSLAFNLRVLLSHLTTPVNHTAPCGTGPP